MEQLFTNFLEAISPALQELLVLLVGTLIAQLIAYVQKQYQLSKTKLSSEQRDFVDFVAYRAVQTVEQLYRDVPAQQKLIAAKNIVERNLAQYGIVIDGDVIISTIEAQVFQQFTEPGLATPQG